MSRICKMNISCQAARGTCIHEKMMMGRIIITLAVLGYWLLA